MRQIALLPAGCQPWHPNIVAIHNSSFAYAATLAIYVYKLNKDKLTFFLHSIISQHKQTITCISWHHKDENILASVSKDPGIIIWDLKHHYERARLTSLPSIPQVMVWHPALDDEILMFGEGKGPFYLWSSKSGEPLSVLKEISPFNSSITQISWHPSFLGRLAIGHQDGTISLYLKEQKPQRHCQILFHSSGGKAIEACIGVSALQWDPLSPNYLLVACNQSEIFLIDSSTEPVTPVAAFLAPSQAIKMNCLAWLPEAPGLFVSGDAESGVLRLWNVSKSSPIENIKLKNTGFQAISIMLLPDLQSKSTRFSKTRSELRHLSQKVNVVCLFLDGGLGVYNLNRRKWKYFRDMGHTETIFDCQFNPENSDQLATSSFDGTIKIWNINTMEPEKTSPGNESVVYAISWSPSSHNSIAGATSKNGVIIWNLEKNIISQRFTSHGTSASVYSIAWNQKDSRKIASTGSDSTCRIHHVDGSLLYTLQHPSTVFGCDWHPKNENILATACEDKNIRIFYVGMNSFQMLKVLSGHTAKVFRVKWSPIKDGILCSSSDDMSIRVWEYQSGLSLVCLEGHTAKVRGLAWSPELPHLLLSGSWDCTIKLWDANTGDCLATITDHGADVYGLAFHPQRPFLLASSSRDSTVRLWSLHSFVSTLFLKMLTYESCSDIFSTQVVENKSSLQVPVLCGQASRQLKSCLATLPQEHTFLRYYHICNFFSPLLGISNFWDLVLVILGFDPSPAYGKGIVHQRDLLKYLRSEAHKLEQTRASWTGSLRGMHGRDELLQEAAFKHLISGNLQRFCEIKIELGEWDDALAVSPGVSMEYWRSLALRRSKILADEGNNKAVALMAASGMSEELVEFFQTNGQLDLAFTVSVASIQGALPPWTATVDPANRHRQPRTPYDISFLMDTVTKRAAQYLQNGNPVNAASSFLSVDGIEGALGILLRGNELEIAVSLSLALGEVKSSRFHAALGYLAWRCIKENNWDLAIDVINLGMPSLQMKKAQLCAHCPLSSRPSLLAKAQLPSVEECLEMAQNLEAQLVYSKIELVKYLLLSSDALRGLKIGLSYLQDVLSQETWELNSTWEMVQLLSAIEQSVLTENRKESLELQIYASYLGALMAMRYDFQPIIEHLFNHAMNLLTRLDKNEDALSLTSEMVSKELEIWKLSNNDSGLNPEQLLNKETLKKRVGQPSVSDVDVGLTVVSGSHLPRYTDTRNCLLHAQPIQGPTFILEDGVSTISLNDALMWAKVNPFSPLATGNRICPF